MALKLRQIEAFRSVMREGSMVRAGAAMSVTQPAVSYLISSLEAEVGFNLFSRRGGKITATPEALQLMAEVDRLYDGVDGIQTAARQIANHERATIRILVTQALANGQVVRRIGEFGAAHLGLKLDVDVDRRMTVLHRISSAQADLGVLSLPPEMEGVVATRLFDSEFLCVCPSPGVLDRKPSVTAKDLSGVPIIAMKPGGVIRPRIESWFTDAGVVPQFAIEVGDAGAAIELARGGLGVAIVSGVSVPDRQVPGLQVVPLDPPQYVEIGAMVPVTQHRNRVAQALVEYLRTGKRR